MSREKREQIIRQFGENGLKLLLENPDSVRELLALSQTRHLGRIDFTQMQVDPTSYVSADFRHVVSDLVLTAPLLRVKKSRARRPLWLSILIEHQSGPERLMMLRLLDYLVQILKQQVRVYGQKHRSLASVTLAPVYHERPGEEQDGLIQLIRASARSDEFVQEIDMVKRTMPQIHREEGIAIGRDEGLVLSRQQTLIMQLREKFGELPAQAEQVISATQDTTRLDGWLKAILKARSLDAMKIT